jgi:hypothetical protein
MSKVIELSDEQYQTIERAAESRGQTPDALLAQVIEELRDPHTDPRAYETDDWLRHLGVGEEEIEASKQRVRDEAEMPYDADT